MYDWKPYVPVAERRSKTAKAAEKLKTKSTGKGKITAPVLISGRSIASTFWGKAWCENLERYSDYDNRLPRGRNYVRNGSVVDLQIAAGMVTAKVSGSRLYTSTISVKPLPADRWKALRGDCAGGIDSLVELLQGRFSNAVMARLCDPQRGLFPAPAELAFTCSCPDWASMCKHVAAALYGIGARLDGQPELLFLLRQVDQTELIDLGTAPLTGPGPADGRVLDDSSDLSALFGLDLEGPAVQAAPAPRRAKGGKAAYALAPSSSSKRTATVKPGTGAARRTKPRTAIATTATTRNAAAKVAPKKTVAQAKTVAPEKTPAKLARKVASRQLVNPDGVAKPLIRPATESDGKPTAQSAARRTAKSSKVAPKQITTAKPRVRGTAAPAAVEQSPPKDLLGTLTKAHSRKARRP